MVVDDSALYRQLVQNVLRDIGGIEIVGVARSGDEVLAQIDQLDPDLLTLDVRMPVVDGIEVLRELKRRRARAKAVMLSGLTAEGAQVTTDALLEGAFDFILKPSGPDAEANRRSLYASLSEKIQAFRDARSAVPGRRPPPRSSAAFERADGAGDRPAAPCEAVVIGTSTGGPVALRELLPEFPGHFPVPILVVQHMPPQYTHSLARRLNEASELEVVEACDGMTLEPGWAFVAPGGRQMKVATAGNRQIIRITDDPPERGCRPAADYLFRSAAAVFGGNVVAVVMTGMGRDGLEGCRELKRRGAFVIAQHPDSCVVYGMPKAVFEEQLADRLLPLKEIAGAVTRRVCANRRIGK